MPTREPFSECFPGSVLPKRVAVETSHHRGIWSDRSHLVQWTHLLGRADHPHKYTPNWLQHTEPIPCSQNRTGWQVGEKGPASSYIMQRFSCSSAKAERTRGPRGTWGAPTTSFISCRARPRAAVGCLWASSPIPLSHPLLSLCKSEAGFSVLPCALFSGLTLAVCFVWRRPGGGPC